MGTDSATDPGREWLLNTAPEIFLGPQGIMRYTNSAQNHSIACYFWPAHGKAKAVIHVIHGHGAYLAYDYLKIQGPGQHNKYEGSWIESWNKAGYSVCGIDLHGHGRSDGLRGYTESFSHYVDDVLAFNSVVKTSDVPGFASLPVFAVAASLGGCIASAAAQKEKDAFSGLVLLAPMLSLERLSQKGANKVMRPVADLLSWLIPTAAIVATERNTMYPELQECWDKDPATYHYNTRIRNAAEYLRATESVMAHLHDLKLPLLSFHSERDTMTDPDGSRALMERASSTDKQLHWVNDMWHIVTKEKGNERLRDDIAAWVGERCK